jgi:hypothetical protein
VGAPERGAPTGAAPTKAPGGRLAAVATALTLVIVAGYAFISATFTLPESPARPAVGEVFSPYFTQRWNVFAPNILKVNRELQLQVQWREDGELVHSDWIDVTGIEFGAAAGSPMPSRITKNSYNAGQAYLDRYRALSDDQRDRVRDTFIQALGGGEFSPIPDAELIDEIAGLGVSRSAVVRFLRYDYMLQRFGAAFGSAYFDRDVERVRWRVSSERPNDFAHRFDAEPQNEVSYTTFGWRQPASSPSPEVVALYDDVIERYRQR